MRLGFAVLFLVFVVVFQASAQDTRSSISEAQRQEKLKTVKPARASKLVKFLNTAENVGIDQYIQFNVQDFRIGFGQISPVSGLTPSIRWEKPRIHSTELTMWLSGAYSIRGYQAYEFQLGYFEQPAPRDYKGHTYPEAPFELDYRSGDSMRPFLYFDSEYRIFPREEFFGIGPGSSEDNRSLYKIEQFTGGIVGGYQFTRSVSAQGRIDYLQPNIKDSSSDKYDQTSSIFDESTAPGLTSQPAFLKYSGSLVAAYYNDPYKPSGLISLDVSRFADRENDQFSFTRYQFDGRGYLPLWCRQRLIAARFFASHDDPSEGSTVPFYLMESLGGQETLRGFHNFRFHDRNTLYMSSEYRWEGSPAVEMAVFYDTGKVFADPAEFNFNHLEHSYGIGLRFKNQRKAVVRIDVGRGSEGTFVYITPTVSF